MTNGEILAIRLVLALLWLASGILSLGLYPVQDSLAMLAIYGLMVFRPSG